VARRHLPSHALFTRRCGRCEAEFDYCGSCQPGRVYCDDECSEAVREQTVRTARAKYNDRDSPEGLAWHALEERDRKGRRARERVGDHRCPEEAGELRVRASAASQAAVEVRDAPPKRPARASVVDWILVVPLDLLPEAEKRLGTIASCPFCGRRGRIVRVVSLEQWRRRVRRGLG
jgi:hypothetical protein